MRRQVAFHDAAGAEGVGSGRRAHRSVRWATHVRSPKRRLVLKEMLKLVGSVGYEDASIGCVLGRAGISRRAFDLRFASKEECYLAAVDAGVEEVTSLVGEATRKQRTWLGKLRAGLDALLEFVDAEPDIGRALVVEVRLAGPEAQARVDESMKKAADFIDLARSEVDAAESPPEIAPRAVVAGVYGMLHSRLSNGAEGGFRELLPGLVYYAVVPYFGAGVGLAEMAVAAGRVGVGSAGAGRISA